MFDLGEIGTAQAVNLTEMQELEEISSSSVLSTTLSELLIEVIKYNQEENLTISFYEYYCTHIYPSHCNSKNEKDKLINNLRVKRTRLNKELNAYNFSLDTDFKIHKQYNISLNNTILEARNKLSGVHIKSIKLYDAYTSHDKFLIFNEEVKDLLKKILIYKGDIQIISCIDTEPTRDFLKDLLFFAEEKMLTNYLQVKYIHKPIIHASSMMYVLLTDTNNNKYIVYYEDITKWSVAELVSPNILFANKFFTLLNTRFDHYFDNEELMQNNDIVPISLDIFSTDFNESIKKLINEMYLLISSNENLEDSQIKNKINHLIGVQKKLKIAFPKMNNNSAILYHHIKLIEIVLLLESQNDILQNTKNILKEMLTIGFIDKLIVKLKSLFEEDRFLFTKNDFSKVDLKRLKRELQLENMGLEDQEKSLAEIFEQFPWNSIDTIVDSLNTIIVDEKLSLRLINNCINHNATKTLQNDIDFRKYIVRKLMTIYGIKLPHNDNFHTTKKMKSFLESATFYNQNIEKIFYDI